MGFTMEMKDRQRWQPEEDAVVISYVNQYGPKEWSLLPQRMGRPSFARDPKSCLERWKNYLRPGLKNGSLSPEEQALVISLQSKHGNKWKLIASHLPGRTPKRLGKWWEVFREKQLKNQEKLHKNSQCSPVQQGQYDHILETFADKYVVKVNPMVPDLSLGGGGAGGDGNVMTTPVLSLAPVGCSSSSSSSSMSSTFSSSRNVSSSHGGVRYSHQYHLHQQQQEHRLPPFNPQVIPSWMSATSPPPLQPSSTLSTMTTVTGTNSPSVSLSLSPSEPRSPAAAGRSYLGKQQAAALTQLCRELEEGRQAWMQHKKEANWRLSRLEQQLESEKARKKREKEEEVEAKIRALRQEEFSCLDRIDADCREQLCAVQRDAEVKEAKMVEMWAGKHAKLARLLDKIGSSAAGGHGIHHHHSSNNKDRDLR